MHRLLATPCPSSPFLVPPCTSLLLLVPVFLIFCVFNLCRYFPDSPKLDCAVTSEATLFDTEVSIECEIDAKPLLTDMFWILDTNGTILREGEFNPDYWTVLTVSFLKFESGMTQFDAYNLEPSNRQKLRIRNDTI